MIPEGNECTGCEYLEPESLTVVLKAGNLGSLPMEYCARYDSMLTQWPDGVVHKCELCRYRMTRVDTFRDRYSSGFVNKPRR